MLLASVAATVVVSGFFMPPVSATIQVICKGVTKAEVAKCDPGYAAVMSKMHWRMYGGHNCTNYVAYQLGKNGVREPKILMGNARDWAANAKKLGYVVNSTPAVGSVGVWPGKNHVTYVAGVGVGYVVTREDNYPGYYKKGLFQVLKITKGDSSYPKQFIHFKDLITAATPVVSGTPKVGTTLKASTGTWQPSGVKATYQWLRGGTAISGATASTYAPGAADVAKAIAVKVTGSKSGFTSVARNSTSTAAVAPGTLVNSVAPALSGTPKVGSTLAAGTGTWSPSQISYSHQWFRDGVAIAGATNGTYALTVADLARAISVRVTAAKPGYTSIAKTTAKTPAIGPGAMRATTLPAITGTPKYGSTLTASPGTWTPAEAALAYQWFRGSAAIPGATATTYALTPADIGAALTVRVTAVRAGYTTHALTSAKTSPVAAGTLSNSTAPSITGVPEIGKALQANPGSWSPAGTTYAYQWLAAGAPIAGATKATFAATQAQLAKAITVRVTASKTGFTPLAAFSAPTAAVKKPSTTPPQAITNAKAPRLAGTPLVGSRLTAAAGTWGPSGVAVSYRWMRNGRPIAYAVKRTYTISAADIGSRLTIRVTGTKAGSASLVKTSRSTSRIHSLARIKAKAKAGSAKVSLTITVKATGVARPGGSIKIKDGKKVVKTVKLKKGKAAVTLKKLKKGKHTFTVSYSGEKRVMARSAKVAAKVK